MSHMSMSNRFGTVHSLRRTGVFVMALFIGEVVEPPPDKRKAVRREILDWGREVQLAQEPGCDGVLIGGW